MRDRKVWEIIFILEERAKSFRKNYQSAEAYGVETAIQIIKFENEAIANKKMERRIARAVPACAKKAILLEEKLARISHFATLRAVVKAGTDEIKRE